jgi:GntR family transcriptional regulator
MVERMISHGIGEPPYRQVTAILRSRITSGELRGRIPSEKALAQEFGVAIGTIRKAMAILRDEGLIYTERGWGSFTSEDDESPGGLAEPGRKRPATSSLPTGSRRHGAR